MAAACIWFSNSSTSISYFLLFNNKLSRLCWRHSYCSIIRSSFDGRFVGGHFVSLVLVLVLASLVGSLAWARSGVRSFREQVAWEVGILPSSPVLGYNQQGKDSVDTSKDLYLYSHTWKMQTRELFDLIVCLFVCTDISTKWPIVKPNFLWWFRLSPGFVQAQKVLKKVKEKSEKCVFLCSSHETFYMC